MNDARDLFRLPGLVQWFAESRWQQVFDKGTLQRARSYANERTISFTVEKEDNWYIRAKVAGTRSQPYRTLVIFIHHHGEWDISTDCSCPVGPDCKHAAAVMQLLSEKIPRHLVSSTPQALTPELLRWLDQIAAAAKTAAPKKSNPASDSRFLAYCVETAPYPPGSYRVVLRSANFNKKGVLQVSGSAAQADPSRPMKYMVDEDVLITATYQRLYRKQGGWQGLEFIGENWGDLLDRIVATGRCYFGASTTHRAPTNYRLITAGKPLNITPVWQTLPDGTSKPVLQGLLPHQTLLPISPPAYLDAENAIIGPVISGFPTALLHAWNNGPAVSEAAQSHTSERLSTLPLATLPTPTRLVTRQLPATAPKPFLTIRKTTLNSGWRTQETLIGSLTFQYNDGPHLTPLAKNANPEHSYIANGTRHLQPRDAKTEAKLTKLLPKNTPLVPVTWHFPGSVNTDPDKNRFLPNDLQPSATLAWLNFLHSEAAEKLRASGWTITAEPDTGLTLREISDFIPELQTETDHGIDWFRFDVSYEIDGKKLSLIPILASAIAMDLPPADSPDLPEWLVIPSENPSDGFIRFPSKKLIELVDQVRHLFLGTTGDGPLRLDRLGAAGIADSLAIDDSETNRTLAALGKNLKNLHQLPPAEIPATIRAELRPYQQDGYRWLQFLTAHHLHGILADDMGLGKTLQTLTHLTAEAAKNPGRPSLVIAPTSVVPNWSAEVGKFAPHLKVVTLQGKDRTTDFEKIPAADLVLTSYPLLARDFETLKLQDWHTLVLDEAQYIKNPKAITAQNACKLKATHRFCLSGTPMENHLGELWSLMRFLMPGFLGDEKTFNSHLRRPIERDRSSDAQLALNRRVSPLILRRTKDQVATELPAKTELIHHIDLTKKQTDLYESVRATMDKRVRDAIAAKGLAQSHIIVLDALLKLRQICCHPQLLKTPAAQKIEDSAKLDYLTGELLPTLLEEGRRILLFSAFTSVLALIQAKLETAKIPFLKLTGQTKDRASLVKTFQSGEIPIFLISLKAGGTGLNLTAADTVIHFDPWWNPAAENQATDRAHRIGQTKPVFVHKLVCRGTIEDRILELQKHKAGLVEALLSEKTSKLRIDSETLSHLLSPLG
ncbi:MAG: DEAD/DEAH box helicase [Luteolibacter sp.]